MFPYFFFLKSHDLYGDGSLVIVPAPGHTPSSIIVFLALPNDRRYALVGDVAWQREGITEREEKPQPLRTGADSEPEKVREQLLRLGTHCLTISGNGHHPGP